MKLEILERTPEGHAHATPLLFVHGMWVGAWCWDEFFMPFFADNGYRTVALSLRGHAGSEGRAGVRWVSIADYVKDLEQVASQLGTPPVLIGISMGGFIIQKYLETHDAPAGILLASAPPTTMWPMVGRLALRNPLPLLAAIFTLRTYSVVKTPQLARRFLFSAELPEEQLVKYHARMQDDSFRAFLDLLGLNLAHPKRVKTPLLVLGGEKDWALGPDAKATARAYGVKAEIILSVGHYMILEPGWKSVAERILNWLKEKGI
jgi:pimeloyl-ACP methyl ester carboxylesterase